MLSFTGWVHMCRVLPVIGAFMFALGCAQSNPQSLQPCPRQQPPFRLLVTAADGALPSSFELEITYSGSLRESFRLDGTESDNDALCCRTLASEPEPHRLSELSCSEPSIDKRGDTEGAVRADASVSASDASMPMSEAAYVFCQLQTNGAAEVRIEANGYAPLERVLKAEFEAEEELEECSTFRTQDILLTLQSSEAGRR